MKMTDPQEMGISTSLDSFLDIVTNVLGLLILICALTIISTQDIQISLGTPIMADVDDDLKRRCFECRDNRLVPLDSDYREAELKAVFKSGMSDSERTRKIKELDGSTASNGFHQFKIEIREIKFGRQTLRSMNLTVTAVDEKVGDTLSQMRKPDSELSKRLAEMDPKKHWLYFIVRPDSFEAFRAARKYAKKRGFQVGWTPHKSGKPIVFSSGGGLGGQTG